MAKMDKLRIPRYGLDVHEDLMLMWQALADGWGPPSDVTEEGYRSIMAGEPCALRGYVGFACSWGGRWGQGYARGTPGLFGAADTLCEPRNYALSGVRSLARKMRHMSGVTFIQSDYRDIELTRPSLIYCDPPYFGRKQHNVFDSGEFWDRMREWSGAGHAVLITEYAHPDDFEVLHVFDVKHSIGGVGVRTAQQPEVLVRWTG